MGSHQQIWEYHEDIVGCMGCIHICIYTYIYDINIKFDVFTGVSEKTWPALNKHQIRIIDICTNLVITWYLRDIV